MIEEQSSELHDGQELDRLERKEMLKKKEKAYLKEIRKSQSMFAVQPIGADRLFRRYWVFNSMNGLFIEDNDPYLPQLLQPEEVDIEVSFVIFVFRSYVSFSSLNSGNVLSSTLSYLGGIASCYLTNVCS